jgi:hypothetical protein
MDRIEGKNKANELSLKKENTALTTVRCLYAIEDTNKDDFREMFEQARLRSDGAHKTIIDGITNPDKEQWIKFKNDLMTSHYGQYYTADIASSLNKTRFDQGREPYGTHAETFNRLLKAIKKAYEAAGASEADKGGMTNTFITAWIAGLARTEGRHALAATYQHRAKSRNPMTWEAVQDMAKTNQEVICARTRDAAKYDDANNAMRREMQSFNDQTRINKSAQERHHTRNIRDIEHKMKEMRKMDRTYKDNMSEIHNAMTGALVSQVPTPVPDQAAIEAYNAFTTNAIFAAATPQRVATPFVPPPPSLPPTASATQERRPQPATNPRPPYTTRPYVARPQYTTRPGHATNAIPYPKEMQERINTGRCFQCGKIGHMKPNCPEVCECGASATREHLPTCRLHRHTFARNFPAKPSNQRSGNGQARR